MSDLAPATALSLLALLGLAVGLALQRWQLGRLHARLALVEQELLSAEQRSGAQATRLAALDGTLAQAVAADSRSQARQAELLARVEVLETQATGDQPYGDAIRLVRQGAREARLVDELGLSPIEAALIVRLHGACAAH
jgi:hypothetical protein